MRTKVGMYLRSQWISQTVSFASFLVIVLLFITGRFDSLELKTLDFLFSHVRGPLTGLMATDSSYIKMGMDVVLIEVDDEAYRLIPYTYPYPRGTVWANLVDNLSMAGARVIVFDMEFDQPDPESMLIDRLVHRSGSDRIREFLPQSGDTLLGEAITRAQRANTRVILASNLVSEPNLLPPQYLSKPIAPILMGDPGLGLVNYTADADNISRRYGLFYQMHHQPEQPFLTLGLASVNSFSGFPDGTLPIYHVEKNVWELATREITPYGYANLLINYYGPASGYRVNSTSHQLTWSTFPRYSLANVMDTRDLELNIPEEDTDWMDQFLPNRLPLWVSEIADSSQRAEMIEQLGVGSSFHITKSPFYEKIILIGASVQITDADTKHTPYHNYMGLKQTSPGLEVHANAIQTILHGNYIKVVGGKATMPFREVPWIQIWIIAGMATLTYIIILVRNPVLSGLLILMEVSVYYGIVFALFTADLFSLPRKILALITPDGFMVRYPDIFQSPLPGVGESTFLFSVAPVSAILLVFITNTVYRIVREQRDKQFYKSTFGAYISPELIEKMYQEKTVPELGGELGIRTAFFSDIQDFSRFSEQVSAAQLVELLNEYLSTMTDILLHEGGTLDKYEGDAIIAFFGAPSYQEDHAYRACITALKMQSALGELRLKWRSEGAKWPEEVHNMRMRIGINTGEIVTGNMGSGTRMNYTMMGDTVNIASRLESSAKQYGVFIQVGEQTQTAVRDKFEFRFIDDVRVKGKNLACKIYELLTEKGGADERLLALLATYNQGLDHYYRQEWDQAKLKFKASEKLETAIIGRTTNPSSIHIERCECLKLDPPDSDWDGVWELSEK